MVLINKQPKLSCHMASMPINDRRLIKPVMLICQAWDSIPNLVFNEMLIRLVFNVPVGIESY